jgi:hypothetical protein
MGEDGDDILDAVDGENDRMDGGNGNDDLFGDFHRDIFEGGNGDDRFFDEFDVRFN